MSRRCLATSIASLLFCVAALAVADRTARADQIADENHNTIYGRVVAMDHRGYAFDVGCTGRIVTYPWRPWAKVHFSGHCGAPLLAQVGGWCDDEIRKSPIWLISDNAASWTVVANGLLGYDGAYLRVREEGSNAILDLPTADATVTRSDAYCP